jgi:phosphate transport system substrate-binding protein
MSIRLRVVFTSVFVAFLLACGGQERPVDGSSGQTSGKPLTIKGSDTMVILAQRLAEDYMKAHPGAVVQVNGGGSGTGIAALINGTIDMAMASRPMTEEEKSKAAQSRGSEIVEYPIALDALAVFVNQANPIQELTIDQIRDIYTGKVKNWSELGGPNATIVMYGRESSSGTYDYFREHVLSKQDFAPAVQTLQGTAAIINAVGKDRNGIGYGGIAYATDVRAIAIAANGTAVAPSEQSVADGTYPLSRKLFFYYPASAPPRVTEFSAWSVTPEAQALVTQVGYFPLNTTSEAAAAATDTTATSATTDPTTP